MKRYFSLAAVCALCANSVWASQDTIGPNGINSKGLIAPDGQPLDGTGVKIGQVEETRPGDPFGDPLKVDDAASSNNTVNPAAVYYRQTATNYNATPNSLRNAMNPSGEIDIHAEGVAGIMISSATDNPLHPTTPTGVAPGAQLTSVGFGTGPALTIFQESAQFLRTTVGPTLRATNISFHIGLFPNGQPDGNQQLTLFLDWSANHHNLLYVVAGTETAAPTPIPTDNFNGITVASSSKVAGEQVFRQVSDFNLSGDNVDATGQRTSVSLIAPGDPVDFTGPNNTTFNNAGTSFAAPLVTATVALLQQHAEVQIGRNLPRWNADARDHRVMKAILLNSADKMKESDAATMLPVGYKPVPPGGLLGMDKTVIKYNPNNPTDTSLTWFTSPAADKSPDGGLIPLDQQMGAGQLNAKRAQQQLAPGEYKPTALIPTIGWDFNTSTTSSTGIKRYSFDHQLLEGSFVSITLAFDRLVSFQNDTNGNGEFDPTDAFAPSSDTQVPGHDQFTDLDLYLVPKGGGVNQAKALSETGASTIEHLFFQIDQTGSYDFLVRQRNVMLNPTQYGVAWWALGIGQALATLGDWNFDEEVTGDDITSMLKALTDLTGFKSERGLDDTDLAVLGDFNGDGFVTNADIQGELDLVASLAGAGSLSSVPEPSALLLCLLATPVLILCANKSVIRAG
jgi:hypothetical protein